MAAKITTTDPNLKKALAAEPDEAVFLVSEQGQATHIVFPIDEARRMFDDYLRRELQIGFDQADRGELHDWEAEDIKRRGRQRLEQESQSG